MSGVISPVFAFPYCQNLPIVGTRLSNMEQIDCFSRTFTDAPSVPLPTGEIVVLNTIPKRVASIEVMEFAHNKYVEEDWSLRRVIEAWRTHGVTGKPTSCKRSTMVNYLIDAARSFPYDEKFVRRLMADSRQRESLICLIRDTILYGDNKGNCRMTTIRADILCRFDNEAEYAASFIY